jgi:ATP-dependent Clp protease ATP-binding subunit ClpB
MTRQVWHWQQTPITIELSDAAKAYRVRTGHDPAYGARPLKRLLQKEAETALSRMILMGQICDGQTVKGDDDLSHEGLKFTVV